MCRLIGVGQHSSLGYITKFRPEAIEVHQDFLDGDFTMDTIASGTESVTSETGVTISSVISESYSTLSFSNQTFSYDAQSKEIFFFR